MTARKMPKSRSRIFHVKGHAAYALENSKWGVLWAIAGHFLWIDVDGHVTKDGHAVCGHWQIILKDHFILPKWFTDKYGHNPRVENVLLDDLLKLETRPIKYGKKHYVTRYYTVGQMARLISSRSKRLGMAYEAKGDEEFETPEQWTLIENACVKNGLPLARFMMMTLQNIGNPWARLRAAGKASPPVFPRVLLARGPIPRERLEDFDYIRGRARII